MSPIFIDTGVFPAPPTTILPIHIIGNTDFCLMLRKFLIFVPNRNNKENKVTLDIIPYITYEI